MICPKCGSKNAVCRFVRGMGPSTIVCKDCGYLGTILETKPRSMVQRREEDDLSIEDRVHLEATGHLPEDF